MKIAIWCLIIVGIYFLYQRTVGDIFREYQRCYDDAAQKILEIEDTQSQSSQCTMQKLTYQEMDSCFSEIQKKSNFAGMIYDAAPVAKKVKTDITTHNDDCPAHQIEMPRMSIYLNSGKSL